MLYEVITNLRGELNNPGVSPFRLAAFVNNVTDEEYHLGSAPIPSIGAAVYFPGPPRMWGLEFRYDFGAEAR